MTSTPCAIRSHYATRFSAFGVQTTTSMVLGLLACALLLDTTATGDTIQGVLRVHSTNPRYFTDDTGDAVYLTGSHTWDTLRDFQPKTLDFTGYLDFLEDNNHNFFRLWTWDLPQFQYQDTGLKADEVTPFPWLRTGAELANDGLPKFDLDQFNQAYFDRLRDRVEEANDRGMYASVMLFEGWHLSALPWGQHPFDDDNNVNGINGDANGNGDGREIHSGVIPAVTAIQEAYVRKVVDTVNDLDNVLYEIANESGSFSTSWQYGMIDMLKDYQADKPNQHPVGMTFQAFSGSNHSTLLNSSADWISPGQSSGGDWLNSPPVADGLKVIITDSDHIAALQLGHDWIWKSFTRGLNPILMDDLNGYFDGHPTLEAGQEEEDARLAMGFTRSYAEKMDLAETLPLTSLCSTDYCLAAPGTEYLIYQPDSGAFDVTLEPGTYEVEWMHPKTGAITSVGTLDAQAGGHSFTAPFSGDAVLYLKSDGSAPPAPAGMMNLVINGEFEEPGLTQTFGGLIDLPHESTIPGWSNANPNQSQTTFQGVTLTLGETLELWSQGFNIGPTAGSNALPTGSHAEIQVFDAVPGADVLTQSFEIPEGSSPATLSFDHWDRVFDANQFGVLVVRVEGSQSGLLLDETLPQSPTIWTARSFSDLAVISGETVTLSFSGALPPGGSGNAFPHVDQVRFDVTIADVPEPTSSISMSLATLALLYIRRTDLRRSRSC